jgi:hypothetical protein
VPPLGPPKAICSIGAALALRMATR